MDQKIKFLELVLSDLISDRDTLEMDLNNVLNNSTIKTKEKKSDFVGVLGDIVDINNKIKTLSEYMSLLSPPPKTKDIENPK
jgi:predicted MPP superfamily phosphohydrolase